MKFNIYRVTLLNGEHIIVASQRLRKLKEALDHWTVKGRVNERVEVLKGIALPDIRNHGYLPDVVLLRPVDTIQLRSFIYNAPLPENVTV